jgi:hypothetical protein
VTHSTRIGRRRNRFGSTNGRSGGFEERLEGAVHGPDGRTALGPTDPVWKGRNKPHRADRRWVQGWSPEQITQRLRVDYPDDVSMRISQEAIYQALYVESRGALKREWAIHLSALT